MLSSEGLLMFSQRLKFLWLRVAVITHPNSITFFFLLYSFRFSFFSLAGLKFHFIRAHSSVNNTKHMFTRYTPENSELGILTAVRPLHHRVFMSKDSYQHERFYEWIFSSTYRIRTTYTLSSHTPAHVLFCLSRAHCIN